MVTNEVYKNEYDVIIIGGGATGAGTARDCALRGLKVLLVERNDYSTGATGRNHGLMHSGARYAVTDGESASECISENMILRRIARHCVEETDGLFITLPEDDLGYQRTFVDACERAGIRADVIDPAEARLSGVRSRLFNARKLLHALKLLQRKIAMGQKVCWLEPEFIVKTHAVSPFTFGRRRARRAVGSR